MAGGVGSRFWPASLETRPKQFLDILNLGRSLLQLTYDRYRTLGLDPADIWVITNEKYVDQVADHLPDVPKHQIIGEPARRNTAPAAYLGNRLIEEKDGEALVIMAPSDHHIEDDAAFENIIRTGQRFLEEEDALITIGIQPDFPHTGYGYINYQQGGLAPHKVITFTEKPDLETATSFLQQGGYLWNAGIFMWRCSSLNKAFQNYSREIKEILDRELEFDNNVLNSNSLKRAFDALPDASIDYEIMERATNVYTIPADMKWSDLGSWKSLYDKSQKDSRDNAVVAPKTIIENASGNLVFAPGKRVLIEGLDDFMVVEDNDILVICPLSSNQKIKTWRTKFTGDKE